MSAMIEVTETSGDVHHIAIPQINCLIESEIVASTTTYRLRICVGEHFIGLTFDTSTTMETKRDSLINTIEGYYA